MSTTDDKKLALRFFQAFPAIEHGMSQKVARASKGEMAVLGYLSSCERDVAPSQLVDAFGISSARIANTLKTLESKGLITRCANEQDRRGVVVHITRAGRSLARESFEGALADIEALFSELGDKDANELVRILERCADVAEARGAKKPCLENIVPREWVESC